MNGTIEEIYGGIITGDQNLVHEKVTLAISEGIPPEIILKTGMIQAMEEVGIRFENGDFFVPEMLISARAMKRGLAVLKPLLVDSEVEPIGKVVIGTVKGDVHDIGKNLVGMMFEGAGFTVVDLGSDVSPDVFLEAVNSDKPDIVAMSAMLTTTMPFMATTIKLLNNHGVRDSLKVIIGGAPLTDDYARDIGADGYAADASRAVTEAKTLLGKN